jgi:6-phosphogluconolactonase
MRQDGMSVTTAVTYKVLPDGEALARAMAEQLLEAAQEAVASRGVARIAISGGNTPKRTFEMLADPAATEFSVFPWDKTDLFWVDERCVPPDDKESNYRMTKLALLDKVPLAADHVFRIEGELDPELAAARYESAVRNRFRLEGAQLPTFDLIALGMGPDGHTASLFPHTAGIHELTRVAIANHVPQKETWRVTLTSPVINQGRKVVFLIGGTDKAEVLSSVLGKTYDPETWPSQVIQPKSGQLLLLLDQAAAAKLPPPAGHLEIVR